MIPYLTAALSLALAVGLAIGYRLGSPRITLLRKPDASERAGVTERIAWNGQQVAELLDQRDALRRELSGVRETLRLVRGEQGIDRELRVVR